MYIYILFTSFDKLLCSFCTRYLALRLCVDNSDKADCLEFCQSEKSIWPHTQNLFLLCHFLSTWEIQRKALFLCWQLQHQLFCVSQLTRGKVTSTPCRLSAKQLSWLVQIGLFSFQGHLKDIKYTNTCFSTSNLFTRSNPRFHKWIFDHRCILFQIKQMQVLLQVWNSFTGRNPVLKTRWEGLDW